MALGSSSYPSEAYLVARSDRSVGLGVGYDGLIMVPGPANAHAECESCDVRFVH